MLNHYIMKEINTVLDNNYNCLLIAPTGWGKTTLLLDLIRDSNKKWVYLSPLRALCDEFALRAKSIDSSFCPRSKKELREIEKFKLMTLTPELCSDDLIFDKDIVWVFDEFHLFYYWGESFRRTIVDLYEVIKKFERSCLLLSATISDEVFTYWKRDNLKSLCINLGNQRIKKEPFKRIYMKDFFLSELECIQGKNPTLVFFKYRREVKKYEKELVDLGYKVVIGLGGESHLFNERISQIPDVEFILGTSALSHGVNLPKISNILITYKVKNLDMWTQMVGRAGRRGEEFKLYTKDHFRLTWLQVIKTLINSYIEEKVLKIKSIINELRRFNYS